MRPGTIQKIFDDHVPAVEAAYRLDERSRRAAWNIRTCRTPAQGYHIDACPNGDYRIRLNNSCRHRACPLCGATETELWLERQRAKELRCPHHQIVFTSPDSLRAIWRWNRRLFTNLYFLAAWHSLRELLVDPRRLAALPGLIAVFQSWADELPEHLHLHFIVTSGGLSPAGQWIKADPQYLLPVPVLAAKFRGKFLAYLREAFKSHTATGKPKPTDSILVPPPDMSLQQCLNLLNKLGREKWHVQIEPAYAQAGAVLKYAGRYIRRGPLSERRIRAYDGRRVTISYAHSEKHDHPSFTLDARDFVLRLLSHVPEKGTHCARVYGLYHSACRGKLNQARSKLGQPLTIRRPMCPTPTSCSTACSPILPETYALSVMSDFKPSPFVAPAPRHPREKPHEYCTPSPRLNAMPMGSVCQFPAFSPCFCLFRLLGGDKIFPFSIPSSNPAPHHLQKGS